jgi:hypothetical protein
MDLCAPSSSSSFWQRKYEIKRKFCRRRRRQLSLKSPTFKIIISAALLARADPGNVPLLAGAQSGPICGLSQSRKKGGGGRRRRAMVHERERERERWRKKRERERGGERERERERETKRSLTVKKRAISFPRMKVDLELSLQMVFGSTKEKKKGNT